MGGVEGSGTDPSTRAPYMNMRMRGSVRTSHEQPGEGMKTEGRSPIWRLSFADSRGLSRCS